MSFEVHPENRWFFAFWCDIRDEKGNILPFPSVSLGFFRIMKDTSEPWWAGYRFYFNNDD